MSEKKNKLTKPKRKAPSTAFKPGGPNPHAFQPGNSGNPSGKSPMEVHLLSKKVLANLGGRAPASWCKAAGLPLTSSKAECLAEWGIIKAAQGLQKGDFEGVRWIGGLVEPKGGPSVNVGIAVGVNGESASAFRADRLGLFFVESDGDGNISEKSLKEMADIDRHYERQGYRAIHGVGVTSYVLKDGDSTPGPADDDGPMIDAEMLGPE